MSYKEKKCVVTGAASGIGRAIAVFFVESGADVALVDVNKEALLQVCESLSKEYPNQHIEAFQCDVRNVEEINDTIDSIVSVFKGFDILINAAGVVHRNPFVEVDEQTWDFVCDINLKGTFFACKQALLKINNDGKIINFSSARSERSDGKHVVYDITKSGVEALTRGVAVSGGERQIIANAISLAYVVTDMNRKQFEDVTKKERLEAMVPLKRMLEMEDVIETVDFLCSNANKSINGQTIRVDGGMSIFSPM